jgi:hypothetical protein
MRKPTKILTKQHNYYCGIDLYASKMYFIYPGPIEKDQIAPKHSNRRAAMLFARMA